jgi:hypothetical protein
MGFVDWLKKFLGVRPKPTVRVLHGSSLVVDVGYRADDNVGMTDYKRVYKVKKGKVSRKLLHKMKKGEQCNFFQTYELKPVTNFAYVVVFEKCCSNPPPEPTKIWNVNLRKKNGKWKASRALYVPDI